MMIQYHKYIFCTHVNVHQFFLYRQIKLTISQIKKNKTLSNLMQSKYF